MKPIKDDEVDPLEDLLPDKNKRRKRRNDHRKYDSREVLPWEKPKRRGHRGDYQNEDSFDYEDD